MDFTNTKTLQHPGESAQPYIEIMIGAASGKVYELSRDSFRIGRSDASDIVFNGEGVSRIHAILSRFGEEWVIRDNGSKNGIQINGVKVNEASLNHGDIVQVGDHAFRFNAQFVRQMEKTNEEPVSSPRDWGVIQHLLVTWLSPAVIAGAGMVFLAYVVMTKNIPQRIWGLVQNTQPETSELTLKQVNRKVMKEERKISNMPAEDKS